MRKRHFRFLSLVFFILGIFFLLNSKIDITGAVIGSLDISPTFSSSLGVVLIIISVGLFFWLENLEEKVKAKHTIVQTRRAGYYLYNYKTGESYSLDDIKELSKNYEMRRELRKEYFSDLLRLYAESPKQDKEKYKLFIKTLSPNANERNLNKRLKQFENVYEKMKDRIEYMDPKRIKNATPDDFRNDMYVRFENEGETLWPEEDSIGFLPFDEVKMNRKRGPLFSVIPASKLISDGYLSGDGLTLNGKWGKDKRKNYLKNTYGIDIGPGQRTMVFFKIEKIAEFEHFGNYENIVIKNKVPLVKVIKKK